MACLGSFFHDALKRLPLSTWRAVTIRLPYVVSDDGDRFNDDGRVFEMRNCLCGSTISRELTTADLAMLDQSTEVRQ